MAKGGYTVIVEKSERQLNLLNCNVLSLARSVLGLGIKLRFVVMCLIISHFSCVEVIQLQN